MVVDTKNPTPPLPKICVNPCSNHLQALDESIILHRVGRVIQRDRLSHVGDSTVSYVFDGM
jgi:hypothetical protein